MMAAMKEVLAELGVPKQRIHSEAFGPASMPADILPAAAPSTSLAARVAATKPASPRPIQQPPTVAENTVVFTRSGKSAGLAAGTTVLDAAESVGVDIPWSCRSGICGTCKVKLLEGKVAMAVEDALSAEEKARGIILACQAKSLGGNLIVDA
jgi:ferredoxin